MTKAFDLGTNNFQVARLPFLIFHQFCALTDRKLANVMSFSRDPEVKTLLKDGFDMIREHYKAYKS